MPLLAHTGLEVARTVTSRLLAERTESGKEEPPPPDGEKEDGGRESTIALTRSRLSRSIGVTRGPGDIFSKG
jgi:hypothetical protein